MLPFRLFEAAQRGRRAPSDHGATAAKKANEPYKNQRDARACSHRPRAAIVSPCRGGGGEGNPPRPEAGGTPGLPPRLDAGVFPPSAPSAHLKKKGIFRGPTTSFMNSGPLYRCQL